MVPRQCDGEHPQCGRCTGYGHTCTWPEDKKDRVQSSDSSSPNGTVSEVRRAPATKSCSSLHWAIQSYDKLIRGVRLDLPESARTSVDLTLSYIQRRLPADIVGLEAPSSSIPAAATCPRLGPADFSANSQRYLGEASDVRFFYTIKKIFRDEDQSGGAAENDEQSYDQGTLHLETQVGRESHADLPTKDLADTYIEIYFFTIHIAYPFVSKPSFMERYERFWKGDIEVAESSSWLPFLCKSRITSKGIKPYPYQI